MSTPAQEEEGKKKDTFTFCLIRNKESVKNSAALSAAVNGT